MEGYEIKKGKYKGKLYWGQHLDIDESSFEPHGFGILIHEEERSIQLGTFKQGKETGQQRQVQSYPRKSRFVT